MKGLDSGGSGSADGNDASAIREAEAMLREAVADPSARFREGQWEAIDALVNRRRKLLVVQRTGWGKSSVYFISTRILRDRGAGPTLIVSPLLALMRNQIESAHRLGIRAETINSSNKDDWEAIKTEILADRVDAVLISPERLSNEDFIESVLRPVADRIGLLVVDEVHCISDWGHDFRPDYRRIVNILRQMPPNMPVLGTTATANDRVVQDVEQQLGEVQTVRGPLVRDSLSLQTLRLSDQAARLAWLAQHIPEFPGTGIVYVLTKLDAERVSAWLTTCDISAAAYYSGVKQSGFADSNAYRQHLEEKLLNNGVKTLVATSALGMGYDKPDLGFAIHYQAPSSVVAYYQQVGRAGRNIETALGVLLSGREDDDIHEYFRETAFPPEQDVHEILLALEDSDGMSVRELESHLNLRRSQIEKVLKILGVENPSPVIKDGSKWQRTPVRFSMDRERIDHLTQQREIEWQEIQAYIKTDTCLMAFLRDALDDQFVEHCGKCANCLGRAIVDPDVDSTLVIDATRFLRRSEFPFEPRKQIPKGALPEYEFSGNIPEALQASEGRVLAHWGDAGWGAMVKEDKHAGCFRDELVEASAEMIEQRWKPEPRPLWVTCVPSRRHPSLVPAFAKRLAVRLGLPFRETITKVRDNEAQKDRENSFHQCRNLDGAFEVLAEEVNAGPVLLVDDVVDSRWTMTILAALLRRAESGLVFPVALASTSTGS